MGGAPLEPLSLNTLSRRSAEYDGAVARMPDIDPYCSRSEWVLSFHAAFAPQRAVFAFRDAAGPDGASYVLLAGEPDARLGFLVQPLEHLWGLASPLVGPDAAGLLGRLLTAGVFPAGAHLLLFGLPLDRDWLTALAGALPASHGLGLVGTTDRRVASLEGGLEGFLGRRPANVRRNLRKARHRAERAGLQFERVAVTADTFAETYRRIVAIERRSWKSATGNGVDRGPMKRFYERMIPRLLRRDAFRLIVARRGDEELGYVHGGTVGRHFRGLQFSFVDDERALSVGNLLQVEMVRWLCEDGFTTYDLGMVVPYKERWAETGLVTADVMVAPRPVRP
jgi:hypothetical protein